MKKIIITVGGTGGHVFPALTLAKQLADLEILFVGGGLSRNRYFESKAFQFHDVSCGTLPLLRPVTALKNMFKISHGIWQSNSIIKEFKPSLIIGFGSYHTLPTLLAGKMNRIPIILHEANRIPGKVNRLLSPFVHVTGVHFPDTKLKGNILEVPIPLRNGYKRGFIAKEEARKHFDLDPDKFTLLVFGGSQGAQKVNQIVSQAITQLPKEQIQVLHFTGDNGTALQVRQRYQEYGIRACVKEFENRMDLAWQAADLVMARAGAGTIAEQLEFEVPGILIPYPHAADNHQESNANFMVDIVKGAVMRREHELVHHLAGDLKDLLSNDYAKVKSMKKSMQLYNNHARPIELQEIVRDVLTTGGSQ